MFDTADQGCILSYLKDWSNWIQLLPEPWNYTVVTNEGMKSFHRSSFFFFRPLTVTVTDRIGEQPETDSFYGYRCYVTPLQTWHFVNFYSCCDHNPKPKFTGDIERLVTRWALNLSLDTSASDVGLGASIPNKWAPEEVVVIKLGNKMISILFSPSV